MSATPALTVKRQPLRSSQLLAVLEECWQQVTIVHPTLPDAVFTIGAGELASGRGLRLGRSSPCNWQRTNDQLPAVFLGAEGLARGPEPVLATVLHEAHGLAHAAGIKTPAAVAATTAGITGRSPRTWDSRSATILSWAGQSHK